VQSFVWSFVQAFVQTFVQAFVQTFVRAFVQMFVQASRDDSGDVCTDDYIRDCRAVRRDVL
jgi:hypothetical protein